MFSKSGSDLIEILGRSTVYVVGEYGIEVERRCDLVKNLEDGDGVLLKLASVEFNSIVLVLEVEFWVILQVFWPIVGVHHLTVHHC